MKNLNPTLKGGHLRHLILQISIGLILSRSKNSTLNFRDVVCRIRLFPILIPKIKWRGSELLLIMSELRSLIIQKLFLGRNSSENEDLLKYKYRYHLF